MFILHVMLFFICKFLTEFHLKLLVSSLGKYFYFNGKSSNNILSIKVKSHFTLYIHGHNFSLIYINWLNNLCCIILFACKNGICLSLFPSPQVRVQSSPNPFSMEQVGQLKWINMVSELSLHIDGNMVASILLVNFFLNNKTTSM